MATLNFIMPDNLKEGFCERKEKQNKVKHSWVPTGQTRAMFGDQIAISATASTATKESGPRLLALISNVTRLLEEIKMKPFNKRILFKDIEKDEPEKGKFLLPDELRKARPLSFS